MSTPPFRAEHVGSLLRPAALLQARTEAEGDQYRQVSGPLKYEQLKQLEDAAIADVVALQEGVGLDVITDGEFRRRSWFQDFLLALSGTGITWVDAGKTISAALPDGTFIMTNQPIWSVLSAASPVPRARHATSARSSTPRRPRAPARRR